MKQLTVDASATAELVVTQTTFYLAFLITLGSAGAIIAQVIRGINNKMKKSREEAEAKATAEHEAIKKHVDDKMREVGEIKDRVEYIYRRMIDEYFSQPSSNSSSSKNVKGK